MSKVHKLINSTEFGKIKEKILPLLKSSIRIRTKSVPDKKIENGTSKIGGDPDLPKDLNWPENEDIPLSFIAQFNLTELTQYDEEKVLPSSGMLYIFYDTIRQIIFDYDETYNEVSKIFYYDVDPSQLSRKPAPKQLVDIRNGIWDAGIFKSCSVTFAKELMLPRPDSFYLWDIGLKEDELYIRLLVKITELYNRKKDRMRRLPIYITHRLFGYSDGINDNNMELDCQLLLEGTPWIDVLKGAYLKLDDLQKERIKKEAVNWRLLFQIDSDHKIGTEWGDVGKIYFFIKNESLKNRDFSLTYAFYQG